MSQPIRSFGRIDIPAPCEADWDSMLGNERVRFCTHCNLQVTNISALTRQEALRLVAHSKGRLCVRFVQRADGNVLTKQAQTLHQITRRVSRIAAGAFTATLGLSSAVAQTRSQSSNLVDTVSMQIVRNEAKTTADGATLRGTILDPNGAVIAGATVELINTINSEQMKTTSSDEGQYEFERLSAGTYTLRARATGFANLELPELQVQGNGPQTQDVTLQVSELVTMGVVAIAHPEDPLIRAAFNNDLNAVVQLLPTTTDINASDKATDMTALAYAVANNNIDMVHVLISAGAMPNGANSKGETPLMNLSSDASVEFLRQMIAVGADVKAADRSGRTVLMNAARYGNFALINELIDRGARVDARDDEGNSVLMSAAENADPEIIKLLIKRGVPLDYKNDDGESAVMVALESGRGENLKLLIAAGASLSSAPEDLNHGLLMAARAGDSITVKILLQAGASAKAKDDDTTVLMLVAENGGPEMLKAIIDAGADLDAVDNDGWTAMMHANEVENVRVLLNAGANASIKNNDGETALGMATKYDQVEIAQLLKSRGAP